MSNIKIGIDLETMSNQPTAAVIAVALVAYAGDREISSYEGKIDPEQAKLIGHVNQETLDWWEQQNPATKYSIFSGTHKPIEIAMETLKFLSKFESEGYTIWANPPTFDCVIIRHWFDQLHLKTPWSHHDERCIRTMKNLIGEEFPTLKDRFVKSRPLVPHDPIEDVRAQMETLFNALKVLRGY